MQNIIFWQYCLPILGFKDVEPIKQLSRLKLRKSPKPKRKRHKTRGQMVLRIPDMLVSVGVRSAPIHLPAPSVDNADLLRDYALTRDKRVRDRIVLQNMGLVRKLVHAIRRKHHCACDTYEDLEHVGVLALIRAIDRYDLTKGLQFTTFAYYLIKGDLRHHIRDKTRTIRVPKRLHYLIGKEYDAIRLLGDRATREAVRQHLKLSIEEWQEFQLFKQNQVLLKLEMQTGEDSGESTLAEIVEDTRNRSDIHRLELSVLLDKLYPEEREIVEAVHFGGLSYSQAGEVFGKPKKAIAQKYKQSLERLRAMCG